MTIPAGIPQYVVPFTTSGIRYRLTCISILRFMFTFGKTDETPVTEFLRTRSNAELTVLNEWLNTRKFAVANHPTISDFSMCGYLFWPDEIGVNWNKDDPNIARWLNEIAALPRWVHPHELMPGYPPLDQV